MKQLELDVRNNSALWPTILAKGYQFPSLIKKYGREAHFGAIMLQQAKKSGMYKDAKYRWPRATGVYATLNPLSANDINRAVFVVREAAGNGLTSNSLARSAGVTMTAANKRIQKQVQNGYLRKFGRTNTETGGISNVYVLTDTGKALLEEVGE